MNTIDAVHAGLWVPVYFGNRFKVARLKRDRLRTQQELPAVFPTMAGAQAEADRRNAKRPDRT